MKGRVFWPASLLLIAIIAIGLFFLIPFHKSSLSTSFVSQSDAPDRQKIKTFFSVQNQQLITDIKLKLSTPLNDNPSKENDDFSEVAQRNITAFKEMHALQSRFNKDEIRNQILDELKSDPIAVRLASNILIDNTLAKKIYGQDQALGRVYSTRLLVRMAEQGDNELLINTTAQLASVLSERSNVSIGEKEDLYDLIRGFIRTSDESELMNNLESFLPQLGFKQGKTRGEIVKIFDQAFYFAWKGKIENAELNLLLGKHFD